MFHEKLRRKKQKQDPVNAGAIEASLIAARTAAAKQANVQTTINTYMNWNVGMNTSDGPLPVHPGNSNGVLAAMPFGILNLDRTQEMNQATVFKAPPASFQFSNVLPGRNPATFGPYTTVPLATAAVAASSATRPTVLDTQVRTLISHTSLGGLSTLCPTDAANVTVPTSTATRIAVIEQRLALAIQHQMYQEAGALQVELDRLTQLRTGFNHAVSTTVHDATALATTVPPPPVVVHEIDDKGSRASSSSLSSLVPVDELIF